MAHVREVAAFVAREPKRCVLVGARPTAPETEYGWIEPGAALAAIVGELIYRVRRFWEKPSRYVAQTAFAAGYL